MSATVTQPSALPRAPAERRATALPLPFADPPDLDAPKAIPSHEALCRGPEVFKVKSTHSPVRSTRVVGEEGIDPDRIRAQRSDRPRRGFPRDRVRHRPRSAPMPIGIERTLSAKAA